MLRAHLRQALPDADRLLLADSTTLQWRIDAPARLDVADFDLAAEHAEDARCRGDLSRPALFP